MFVRREYCCQQWISGWKGNFNAMYVESLKLENIKAFEALDLDFKRSGEGEPRFAGINVFVGGNASGKSTLLKCITMALGGPKASQQLMGSPDGWIRRGASRGIIKAKVLQNPPHDTFRPSNGNGVKPSESDRFWAGLEFISEDDGERSLTTLEAMAGSHQAERGPWYGSISNGWFRGAYGPFRRLAGSPNEEGRYALGQKREASCITLFREDASLSESEFWLRWAHARSLEQKDQNSSIPSLEAQATDLLNDGLLPDGFRIARVTVDRVLMETPNGGEMSLQDVSDGCRSAFALLLDIVHNMAMHYPQTTAGRLIAKDPETGRFVIDKPGVILIDEIEAHLHPSWQRLICEWLKTRFSRVQFFVTTHSPLIAQSADEGGIFVLPLPQEIASGQGVRRLTAHEQDRVLLGSTDKVLLGEAFGLQHTWSTRTEQLVNKWEKLVSLRHAIGILSPAEEKEYKDLSKQVEIVFDDRPEEAISA